MPSSMSEGRREFMKKMGAAGATLSSASVAGCAAFGGSDDDTDAGIDDEDIAEEDLPAERRIDETFFFLTQTESYNPARFRSNTLVADAASEELGVDIQVDPHESAARHEAEADLDFHIQQYGYWTEEGGDPDAALSHLYYSDGPRNFSGYNYPEYDELVEAQRREFDPDTRQEIVYEAQEKMAELRLEVQYVYVQLLTPYRTDVIQEDSVTLDVREFGTWNLWTNLDTVDGHDGRVITTSTDPANSINPYDIDALSGARNESLVRNILDPLVRYDTDLEPVPWIVEEVNEVDETTISVTISDEFEFHDGEPLTVDDVVYSIELALDSEATGWDANVVSQVESVEQTGDDEVTFHLFEATATFVNSGMFTIHVVPRHQWEPMLEDFDGRPEELSFDDETPLIGSGPFEYETWDRGERFTMSANKDHPIAPPNIEERIQVNFQTTAAELAALRGGDIHIIDPWYGDNSEAIESAEEDDAIEVDVTHNNRRELMEFNMQNPLMASIPFRQAMAHITVDRQPEIVRELYDDFAVEANVPYPPPIEFWRNEDVPFAEGGPEAARQVLIDAGFQYDEDGNLYYPEDWDLSVPLDHQGEPGDLLDHKEFY